MKKLISVFLILAMCLCCLPAFAQTADITAGEAILSVNGVVSGKLESGYASIKTSFTNNTEKDASVTMLMAEYSIKDGYKSLVSSSKETKVIPAGKSASASPGIKISSKDAQIRYFAYNSATLEPLAVKDFVTQNFKLAESDEDTTVYNIYSFDDMQNTDVGTDLTETLSNPEICTWYGNKKSATSITLDDGVYSAALTYLELFKKYDIHATEFMVTNWIANTTNSPFELKTAVTNWQKIFDTGYIDLGNHSQTHEFAYDNPSSYTQNQLETDITVSHHTLREYFPNQSVIAFASPWGRQPENAITEMKKAHYANRTAGGDIVPGKTPANFFEIPTIAVQYETPLATLNKRVDDAIKAGGWNTELYHGIGTSGYATNIATMEEHLKYINSKPEDVWAGSFTEVVKYIYERDNAKASKLWATDSSIGIKVTDSLDDELFDYPLTIKVNLPAAWSGNVKCVQNQTITAVKTFSEGGKTYAYVDIIPDGGNMIISK